MNGTMFFQADPVYTARRLHSEGQGVESNPFPYDTDDHELFKIEMELLDIEDRRREAGL
jgi:hypothetical protein